MYSRYAPCRLASHSLYAAAMPTKSVVWHLLAFRTPHGAVHNGERLSGTVVPYSILSYLGIHCNTILWCSVDSKISLCYTLFVDALGYIAVALCTLASAALGYYLGYTARTPYASLRSPTLGSIKSPILKAMLETPHADTSAQVISPTKKAAHSLADMPTETDI